MANTEGTPIGLNIGAYPSPRIVITVDGRKYLFNAKEDITAFECAGLVMLVLTGYQPERILGIVNKHGLQRHLDPLDETAL